MSTPAHLWLNDENGSPITGGCLMPTRLGSIELRTLTHNITIPVEASLGKLTGTRVHNPIVLQKEFDPTTPLLFRALCQGRTFKSAKIAMYQITESGAETEYFTINMENVKITSMTSSVLPGGVTGTHIENIELRYESITWKYITGNIQFKDAWNQFMTS